MTERSGSTASSAKEKIAICARDFIVFPNFQFHALVLRCQQNCAGFLYASSIALNRAARNGEDRSTGFRLWGLVHARTKTHRQKPALLKSKWRHHHEDANPMNF
jgi:hypothetical protein